MMHKCVSLLLSGVGLGSKTVVVKNNFQVQLHQISLDSEIKSLRRKLNDIFGPDSEPIWRKLVSVYVPKVEVSQVLDRVQDFAVPRSSFDFVHLSEHRAKLIKNRISGLFRDDDDPRVDSWRRIIVTKETLVQIKDWYNNPAFPGRLVEGTMIIPILERMLETWGKLNNYFIQRPDLFNANGDFVVNTRNLERLDVWLYQQKIDERSAIMEMLTKMQNSFYNKYFPNNEHVSVNDDVLVEDKLMDRIARDIEAFGPSDSGGKAILKALYDFLLQKIYTAEKIEFRDDIEKLIEEGDFSSSQKEQLQQLWTSTLKYHLIEFFKSFQKFDPQGNPIDSQSIIQRFYKMLSPVACFHVVRKASALYIAYDANSQQPRITSLADFSWEDSHKGEGAIINSENYRGLGIGTELLKWVIHNVKQDGCKKFVVIVQQENRDNLKFFQKVQCADNETVDLQAIAREVNE